MRSKPIKYGLLLACKGGSWDLASPFVIEAWHGKPGSREGQVPWVRVLESGSEGFVYYYMPWKPVLNFQSDDAIVSGMPETIEGLPGAIGRVRWYKGPQGLGIYTVDTIDGYYKVFYAKPAGTGARRGKAKYFVVVDYKTTKRRAKTKAIDRAFELAYGYARRERTKKPRIAQPNTPGLGYCMRQKKHVFDVVWEETTAKNGRTMLVGECPECKLQHVSTKITKYGRLVHCPECSQYREGRTDDYLCVQCRANAESA